MSFKYRHVFVYIIFATIFFLLIGLLTRNVAYWNVRIGGLFPQGGKRFVYLLGYCGILKMAAIEIGNVLNSAF